MRDVIRRTDLASGTFYNYFDGKDAVFRAVVEEVGADARRARARGAPGARTGRSWPRASARSSPSSPPSRRRSRSWSATRTRCCRWRSPSSSEDLDERLRRGVDVEFCAHAMVAVGLEIGGLMLARKPRDVDGATAFAAGLFREVTSLAWLRDAFPFHNSRCLRARAGAAVHRLGRLHRRHLREPAVDVLRPAVPGGGLQAGTRDRRAGTSRSIPTGAEAGRLDDYLRAAQAAGVEPLVSIQHTRGDSSRCGQKKNFSKGICKLPSARRPTRTR